MTTAADVVNEALRLIGSNDVSVTGTPPTFDSSAAGIAAAATYTPTVLSVARRFGWDFSRNTIALALSGNAAPFPYTYEYLYPSNGVQIRQLSPQTLADKNNPTPVNWAVAYAIVGSAVAKVVHTNLASAQAIYTGQPTENQWDALFHQAVVRELASALAMALSSRPETSRDSLMAGAEFGKLGETRDS